MSTTETTLTLAPEDPPRRSPAVLQLPQDAPDEGAEPRRDWFTGAIPGTPTPWKSKTRIGMD